MGALFRLVEGISLAAVRTLLSQGPSGARRVIGTTLRAAHPPQIPQIHWWDLARMFSSPSDVTLYAGEWTDGCTAPLERYMIAHLLRFVKPRKILEVGTYRGSTTRILVDNMPEDARIYTIDLPPAVHRAAEVPHASDARLIESRQIGVNFRDHARAGAVTQILGNTFDDSTWNAIPSVEFAFIDASHSYEAVRNDSEHVLKCRASRGIVIWHDYSEAVTPERGVGKYIRELMAQRHDVFICPDTTLALLIPSAWLDETRPRLKEFLLS